MILNQTLYTAVSDKLGTVEAYDLFIRLLGKMEGFKTRLKELHWDVNRLGTHKLIDDILNKLSEFQDSIAEDFQGEFGDIPVGTIRPTLPESTSLEPLLKEMRYELLVVPKAGVSGTMYTGMLNVIDDFYHKLNVFIYLSRKS